MNKQSYYGDARLKALTLRAEAAEQAVQAAKLFCKVAHLEAVAAKLMVRRLELYEEAEMLTARGKGYYAKMKEHQAALEQRKDLKDRLELEIARKRDKAVKLATQADSTEKRAAGAEEKIRAAKAEADRLRRERDKLLIEARKLEAEAVRAESLL